MSPDDFKGGSVGEVLELVLIVEPIDTSSLACTLNFAIMLLACEYHYEKCMKQVVKRSWGQLASLKKHNMLLGFHFIK